MDALVAAAKAEGGLNTIALPRDWCNYGAAIDGFTAKYGIPINGLNPGGGSKDELAAIMANKDNPGPQAPDVVDVGLAFGPQGVDQGLYQPYKVATWDTIPDSAKSADGMWYGDYYGVMSFEVNTKVVTNVPKDWPDLLKPEYKSMVALFGDPTSSNQAQSAVWAAGLANGGTLDSVNEGLQLLQAAERRRQLRAEDRRRRRPSRAARRRSAWRGRTTPSPTRIRSRATRRSRSSSRRPAASVACTSRRSASTRPIRTRRSSGWSTCTPTKARTSG